MPYCNKYNPISRKSITIKIPDGCSVYEDDMGAEVVCPNCKRTILFGDSYTSNKYFTIQGGFGYAVCHDCYNKELFDGGF